MGGGSIFTEEGEDEGNEMMMGDNQMFMQPAPVEYRLFRFIDTDVEPGKTYRYRVRVSLWNPNIKLHPQHLASEDVATPTKLASEPSEPSEAVRVPQQSLLLARTLDRADARKVRGLVEASCSVHIQRPATFRCGRSVSIAGAWPMSPSRMAT